VPWAIKHRPSMPMPSGKRKSHRMLGHTSGSRSTRQRALACIFLNRTSFSGIIAPGAGPIGGQMQTSAYHLDCRFPRETLIRRIREAEALRHRVAFVWNTSWVSTLSRIDQMQRRGNLPSNVFYYFDPPFFEKADRLYTHYFRKDDHRRLRDCVVKIKDQWILSYDSAQHVIDLYAEADLGPTHVELLYSTAGNGYRRTMQEVIISNLAALPSATRLWRRSQEWKPTKNKA